MPPRLTLQSCIITPKTSDFVHAFLNLSCFVGYVDDAKVLAEVC
jgi:hypothetical protein